MDPAALKAELGDEARRLGFAACGVTSVRPFSEARTRALAAIDAGRMDGMPWYTRDRVEASADIGRRYPWARSIVALAWPYRPARPEPPARRRRGDNPRPLLGLRVHARRRPHRRLPRPPWAALRRPGRLAPSDGSRRSSKAFRRSWVGPRPRHRRTSRDRIRRQARVGDHARSRLVRTARINRGLGCTAGRRALEARVRQLQRMHPILSDRCDRRAGRDRRPALHLVPDHRARGRHPRRDAAADGNVGVRVRPLPGGVPDQSPARSGTARRRERDHAARPGATSGPGRMPRAQRLRVHHAFSGHGRGAHRACRPGPKLRHRARQRRGSCGATGAEPQRELDPDEVVREAARWGIAQLTGETP